MLTPHISGKLSFHARNSLKEAAAIALSARAHSIEPKHLLLAISLEKGSIGSLLLKNLGITETILQPLCFPELATTDDSTAPPKHTKAKRSVPHTPTLSAALKTAITRAYSLANQLHYPYVGSEHILYAAIEKPDNDIQSLLDRHNIDTRKLRTLLQSQFGFPTLSNLSQIFDFSEIGVASERATDTETESPTPFLDQYGIDIMREEEADPSWQKLDFRAREVERMIHILGRRTKNNPLLIGEPGVGKTTLVYALAQRIAQGTAGSVLADKRIVSIDLALIVAGTNFRGEFESRLKEIIREASENEDVILFIDEIHTLVGAGNASGSLDAANILKPALSRGEIQCIGATTLTEHKRHIEKDSALERRFQPVLVAEPTPEEAFAILSESRRQYEDYHFASIPPETLRAAVDLSVRYINDRFLPDKAFDLLDEAASAAHQSHTRDNKIHAAIRLLEQEIAEQRALKESAVSEALYDHAAVLKAEIERLTHDVRDLKEEADREFRASRVMITPDDIARVVERTTRIPYDKIVLRPGAAIARLQEALQERIVGQNDILRELSSSIVRTWSGIGHQGRPLGSFLFLGPSGVGKTLTAKALAETLFESDRALIRLDMSEFMERHNVAQIIGAPAGYVGYGEGGRLTEAVRRQPYSVVLFDEIEKAHPDVFNLLLQILDEGFLTDADGRRISFRNTIVILTSNIGTQAFNRTARLGFHHKDGTKGATPDFETVKNDTLEELRRQLRPELLNRLDHISVFRPLEQEHIRTIVDQELRGLKERLSKQKVSVRFPARLAEWLMSKVDASVGGARFIRNAVQTHIETPIALALLNLPRPARLAIVQNDDAISCIPIAAPRSKSKKKPAAKRKSPAKKAK